jgi:hypothetical protein
MTSKRSMVWRKSARRRSEAEWRVLVEQFDRSGQSRAKFSSAQGLHPETLRYWQRKVRARRAARSEFMELRPSPARASQAFLSSPLAGRWTLDIAFPDGTTARLGG